MKRSRLESLARILSMFAETNKKKAGEMSAPGQPSTRKWKVIFTKNVIVEDVEAETKDEAIRKATIDLGNGDLDGAQDFLNWDVVVEEQD